MMRLAAWTITARAVCGTVVAECFDAADVMMQVGVGQDWWIFGAFIRFID